MAARAAPIRTPDQRIRIFVSSTLRELETERRAVRAVIERMRLTPVMFELGARPHPPRELYRSYLAQSDVFLGIYGESYGWVAPGEEISGLEDEYRLSGGLPSLIYVREPAPDRNDRLRELLARIRDDDRSSYKSFRDADELASLVADDIATLLSERFDAPPRTERAADIPAPYNALVGRQDELRRARRMLAQPDVRMITFTGPGGIGKSRLAIEVAAAAAASGREVAFALLETVTAAGRVLAAVARSLGVRDAADEASLEDTVIAAIGERDLLLVIDNMEHLLDAAPLLVRLITRAPKLQLLITSRSPLRVRAEHVIEIGPLRLPEAVAPDAPPTAATDPAASPAVVLFVQRAMAVHPAFRLTRRNLQAIVGICRAVDGVPLAIELAAARVRSLSCEQILQRLDSALTLLVGGPRDLPQRQRTLRATVAWSVDLLDEEHSAALASLSTFTGSFLLDSAERVLAATGIADPLAALDALVDASLVGRADDDGTPVFRLLALVRAFAAELGTPDGRHRAQEAWIEHYRTGARRAVEVLRGPDQLTQLRLLELEAENLTGVSRVLLDGERFDDAADYLWSLYLYLWIGGYLGIVQERMSELLDTAERRDVVLQPRTRAIALYYVNANRFWQEPGFDAVPPLTEGRELFDAAGDVFGASLTGVSIGLALLARPDGPDVPAAVETMEASLAGFRRVGDSWGQAMALVMLGRIAMLNHDLAGAGARFEESLALASAQGERLGIVIALNHRGWARFFAGDPAGGREDFGKALDMSLALEHDEGVAYGLEGFVALRAAEGDARGAGLLLGAAQELRRRKGVQNPEAFEFAAAPLDALRRTGSGSALDAAIEEGRRLPLAEVLDHVRA